MVAAMTKDDDFRIRGKILQDTVAGGNLRRAMQRLGLSITTLSKASGVPQGTISRIVRGQTVDPSPETLRKLCASLNLSIEQILGANGGPAAVQVGAIPITPMSALSEYLAGDHSVALKQKAPIPPDMSDGALAVSLDTDECAGRYTQDTVLVFEPTTKSPAGRVVLLRTIMGSHAIRKASRDIDGLVFTPINPDFSAIKESQVAEIVGALRYGLVELPH